MEIQDNSNEKEIKLIPLTPSKEAENAKIYNRFLIDAILNPDIYNIALTGSYGSGKSSVITTFLEYEGKEFKAIRISLADFSFKSEKNQNETTDSTNVEVDLLQQILFQTEDWAKNGPDEGIEKLSPKKRLWLVILSIIIGTIAYFILFEKDFVLEQFFSKNYANCSFYKVINYLALFVLIGSFVWVFLNIYSIFRRIRPKRIQIQPFAVDLANEKNKNSLINKYLLEIVNLFKDENIDLVILEDIDRLKDHSLFLDLKRLNSILRLNPSILKKTTFIYAIKDSVFKDEKDKTKFFDLVIPVIPYVTSLNSKNKFLKMIAEAVDGELSENIKDVISITSLRIDEMRTIINISNEFKVFRKINKVEKIKDEKLLAIIVYKNLFPIDFENAISGASDLQKVFESKERRIAGKIFQNKNELTRLGIQTSEKENLKSEINELEDMLEHLDSTPFTDAFKFDSGLGNLDFGISKTKNKSGKLELTAQSLEKRNVLVPLIKRGYISSDFMYYISLFHEGFLSKNDRKYLDSVKQDIPLEFAYKLDSARTVYNELTPLDWKTKAILNFDLFNYCFSVDIASENIKNVYFSFKDDVKLGYSFVYEYFDVLENKEIIIHNILFYWKTFTDDIIKANYDIKKLLPFMLIHHYGLLPDQNTNNSLTKLVNNSSGFVSFFDSYNWSMEELLHLQSNLKQLNVKLKELTHGGKEGVFEAVYEANAYEISVKNLLAIFKHNGIKESLSYSVLQLPILGPLKLYIEDGNLDLFIGELLNMYYGEEPTEGWKEDKKLVVDLLNLDEDKLSISSKNILIRRANFEKIDFSEIGEKSLWKPLCLSKKVNSKWENLLDYFIQKDNKEISTDSGLLDLVNDVEWVKNLPQLENENSTIAKYDSLITNILYIEFEKPIGLRRFLRKLDFSLDQENINENSNPVNIKNAVEGDFFNEAPEVYKKLKEVRLTDVLHLEYAKKNQDLLLNNNEIIGLSAKELTYILNENFKLDIKYKVLFHNSSHIVGLDGRTITEAFDVIIKIGDYSSFELMKQLMNALALEFQVKLFNHIFIEKDKFDYKVNELLPLFKGTLKFISEPLRKFKMKRSESIHQFALNLKSMGLITTYNPKNDFVEFKRNTKNVSDL